MNAGKQTDQSGVHWLTEYFFTFDFPYTYSEFLSHNSYSYLSAFTGFAVAALNAWKLTVINAINKAIPPERTKSTHSNLPYMQNLPAICL